MIVITSTGAFDSSQFGDTIVYHTWITPPGLNAGVVSQPTATYIPVGRVDFNLIHPTLTDTRSVPLNFDATCIATSLTTGDTVLFGLPTLSNLSKSITAAGLDSFTTPLKTIIADPSISGYGLYLNLTDPVSGLRDDIVRITWGPDIICNIVLDSLEFGTFEITKPIDASPIGIDALRVSNIQRTCVHFPEYTGGSVDLIFQTPIWDTDNPNIYFDQTTAFSSIGIDSGFIGNPVVQNISQGILPEGLDSLKLGNTALWQGYVASGDILRYMDFNNPYRRQADENIGLYFWDSLYLGLVSGSINGMVFGTPLVKHIYEAQVIYPSGGFDNLAIGNTKVIYAPQSLSESISIDAAAVGIPTISQYGVFYDLLYTAPTHIEYSQISINGLKMDTTGAYIKLAISKTMVPSESDFIAKHTFLLKKGDTYKQNNIVMSPGENLLVSSTGPLQWRVCDIRQL